MKEYLTGKIYMEDGTLNVELENNEALECFLKPLAFGFMIFIVGLGLGYAWAWRVFA